MALSERERNLAIIGNLLRTPDGKVLMAELQTYADARLLGTDPQHTGYLVGRADVFRDMKIIQEAIKHDR